MSFEVAASIRRLRPQGKHQALRRRPVEELSFVSQALSAGAELLLDTCVYLDVLQGRTSAHVDRLLRLRITNHSTVALAELTHALGRLDPGDPRTKLALKNIRSVIEDIPEHRLSPPSARVYAEAGMLAGLLARLTGRASGTDLLNDALLYFQAQESGRTLLTANVADFDHLDQLAPGANLLFYTNSADA